MTMRIRLLVLAALVSIAGVANISGRPDSYGAASLDYRRWTHVKSAVIDPKSPTAGRFGGIHHIYANDKAMEGYRTGQFPDGSVIVFDQLETRENAGTTQEGSRKFIDVMTKDSKRHADTGGWEFEEFTGDNHTDQVLTAQAKAGCFGCHTRQREHDFVFSTFRK
jgi:cytochrome P460